MKSSEGATNTAPVAPKRYSPLPGKNEQTQHSLSPERGPIAHRSTIVIGEFSEPPLSEVLSSAEATKGGFARQYT